MNTWGTLFRLTTFGESHGAAIGGVIDGCPANMDIDFSLIERELARRRGDNINGTTDRKEADEVEWLSGLMDGKTLGTPLAFMIRNKSHRSDDYDWFKELYRPGHGDYTWQQKYGIHDHRGGGRCSARETAARVVAGAIAKQILQQKGIAIASSCSTPEFDDPSDTYGGTVLCKIDNVPAGLGEPLFNRLPAQLAHAMFSTPSVTGFEMGEGFRAAEMRGSEYRDEWNADFTTKSNHCGGIMGGLSNAMPILFRVALHPVITVKENLPCIDQKGNSHIIQEVPGRHDMCHVPRAAVVIESMAALTILDNLMLFNLNR